MPLAAHVKLNRPLCRHCQRRYLSRSRGLCHRCFETRDIRDLYAPQECAVNNRGSCAGQNPSGELPDASTRAEPGSVEKMAVLEERAEKGLALWHPDDYLPPD